MKEYGCDTVMNMVFKKKNKNQVQFYVSFEKYLRNKERFCMKIFKLVCGIVIFHALSIILSRNYEKLYLFVTKF